MNASVENQQSRAIGDWAENNQRRLYLSILQRVRNHSDAEELMQQTLCKTLATAIPHEVIQNPNKLSSWVFRTAHNLIIDRARKKSTSDSSDTDYVAEVVADGGDSPAAAAIYREEWDSFRECAQQLSQDELSVLWDRISGKSHREIASEHGWEKVNHSEKLQSSAKHKIVQCMEGKRS